MVYGSQSLNHPQATAPSVSFHPLNLVLASCLNRLGEEAEDEYWGLLDVYAYNIGVHLCAAMVPINRCGGVRRGVHKCNASVLLLLRDVW